MKNFLKILQWIISVFIILMGLTNIITAPLGAILLTLAGLIILPPCYNLLKNKISKYNKNIAIILCLCFSFISFYLIGSTTTNEANAKSNINNAINSDNMHSNIVKENNNVIENNSLNSNLINNSIISENNIENQISNNTENTLTIEENISNNTETQNIQKSGSTKTENTSSSSNKTTSSSSTKTSGNGNVSTSSSSSKSSTNTSTSSGTKSTNESSTSKTNSNTTKKSNTSTTESTTPNSATVYITDTGSKYHRSGCQYLKQSKHAISKSNAISEGYTACSKCKP